ncbi:hypothetical protein PTTG_30381 [Puccinia triticina 1-1 BBBD Race 1]|uniref:Uncharacterized protein n=1 Tax=Puccinia triticina (isolate 1-1 / race 1 (BBBD)) TaxID=630390 RepID=A0A180FZ22_PUCT1|nr:hypothetical protein PTTG_30381 [Puccinia triticina 1-1 BBBD Race 1]
MSNQEGQSKVKLKTGTERAVALADALSKYQKLGKAIEPQLSEDGVNFPDWELSLKATVTRVFEAEDYFVSTAKDGDTDRAALTGVLVENSVHLSLVALVRGKAGRVAFTTLQSQFANVSWTYIMSRWAKASDPTDVSADLNTAYSEMQTCLDEIEKRTGAISKDLVLALLLHQRCHPLPRDSQCPGRSNCGQPQGDDFVKDHLGDCRKNELECRTGSVVIFCVQVGEGRDR